ncbi:MAG: Coenzyme F420 hydrogenase/dehydrogenase, beta subunit C-terminal domain [bacterium]|nr:Coenzyme F420 hydrogenase/dehydrogenase, beta subunit C-terminal domain [bacterium]
MKKALRRHKEIPRDKLGFDIGQNVSFVPQNGLCTMCSTCESVCPEDAIVVGVNEDKGTYEPFVLDEKCVQCGTCVDACPGYELDLKGLADDFESEKIHKNKYIGNYSEILRMYSTDRVIAKFGASGGMVTGILDYLLSSGAIDGAIVTKMSEANPIETISYVASSREELLLSQKSKYLPTRLNGILKMIIRGQISQKRIAFAGLPCHIEGLRLAQRIFPVLKERIVFVISLFCSRTPSFHATQFLLDYHGINKSDLERIDYRGNGHPGELTLHLKTGSSYFVNHLHWTYWGHAFMNFFWPSRCFMCPDKTGELSDISIGDNWQELWISPRSTSTVIARNSKSRELLHQMVASDKAVILNSLAADEFIGDQNLLKKRNIGSRLLLMKLIGRKTPLYYEKFDVSLKELLSAFRLMTHVLVSEKNLPFPYLKVYIYLSYIKERFLIALKRLSSFRYLFGLVRIIGSKIVRVFQIILFIAKKK